MRYNPTTEALLEAIKQDVRTRVDEIVDDAEETLVTCKSDKQVNRLVRQAQEEVEEVLAEAVHAMTREIRRAGQGTE